VSKYSAGNLSET